MPALRPAGRVRDGANRPHDSGAAQDEFLAYASLPVSALSATFDAGGMRLKKDDHKPKPSPPAPLPSIETTKALRTALGTYLTKVSAHLSSRRKSASTRKVRRLTELDSEEVVRGWFAECEVLESSRALLLAWNALLDDCAFVFDERRARLGTSGLLRGWLRRRGAYAQIAAGRPLNVAGLANQLINDVRRVARERRVIRVMVVSALFPYGEDEDEVFPVGLYLPKGRIDLGPFEAWSQPRAHELQKLFECDSSALFFPKLVTSTDSLAGTFLLKVESILLSPSRSPKEAYVSDQLAEKPPQKPRRERGK